MNDVEVLDLQNEKEIFIVCQYANENGDSDHQQLMMNCLYFFPQNAIGILLFFVETLVRSIAPLFVSSWGKTGGKELEERQRKGRKVTAEIESERGRACREKEREMDVPRDES